MNKIMERMEIDPETAKRLFEIGGFFILLGVPQGTEFGIDLKSWNTGEKFRGVKLIPPGLHYVFYSSVGNCGDTAPRAGFFHYFKQSEVLVRKWDKNNEGVSFEPVPESEIVGLKDNLLALDGFMGPYPYDIWEKWQSLTGHITEDLIKMLVPLSGEVRSALELQSCTDADRPRGVSIREKDGDGGPSPKKSRTEDDLLPNLKPMEGTQIRFTEFPTRNYPEDATPSQITEHSLDSSYLFEQVLLCYKEPLHILGELEFCFICFLVGHSLEAFEQWKKIFNLFCSCDKAIKKHRRLFDEFLTLAELQVVEIPEEFLADIVANNNFVYSKLRDLFRSIKESDLDGKLKCKTERFKKSLTGLFQWDFSHLESEDEDDAPVVVNL